MLTLEWCEVLVVALGGLVALWLAFTAGVVCASLHVAAKDDDNPYARRTVRDWEAAGRETGSWLDRPHHDVWLN
jgi:hypothetical protein